MLSILRRRDWKKVMIKLFKQHKIVFLDEKWNVLSPEVKVQSIPRIHELIYFTPEKRYYRVINVIYGVEVDKCKSIFVIIEQYTDDFKLMEEE